MQNAALPVCMARSVSVLFENENKCVVQNTSCQPVTNFFAFSYTAQVYLVEVFLKQKYKILEHKTGITMNAKVRRLGSHLRR
jgi:hypothetical protein